MLPHLCLIACGKCIKRSVSYLDDGRVRHLDVLLVRVEETVGLTRDGPGRGRLAVLRPVDVLATKWCVLVARLTFLAERLQDVLQEPNGHT